MPWTIGEMGVAALGATSAIGVEFSSPNALTGFPASVQLWKSYSPRQRFLALLDPNSFQK